jgi:glycosyltransferase involved in cell wall biosynthesis
MAEHRVRDHVIVFRPGRYPARIQRLPWWDRYVLRRHARQLMDSVGWRDARQRILYISHPMFWPYVEHFPDRFLVYHADDAFALMPGWTAELDRCQAQLIACADLLLASSAGMAAALPDGGSRKARLIPNAADAKLYMDAREEPCPAELLAIPSPRIGYAGSINLKVDLSLVADIARQRPDWHWVLLGPISDFACGEFPAYREYEEGYAACRTLQNVHFVGSKSGRETARYAAHMDVNTMCYRTTPGGWWTAIYPLKLHEYLAAGRPIVAADLETLLPFSAVVAIAHSTEEWIAAIEDALNNGGVGTAETRQAVAMANTWDHRIEALTRWLTRPTHSALLPDSSCE